MSPNHILSLELILEMSEAQPNIVICWCVLMKI